MSTTRATTVIEQPPNAITPAYEPQCIPLESYSGQVSAENESATPFLDRHSNVHHAPDEGNEVGQGPLSGAINVQQHWNEPRSNTWKITAAFFAFMNIGMAQSVSCLSSPVTHWLSKYSRQCFGLSLQGTDHEQVRMTRPTVR